ncbi:hypothetical protein DSL72_005729 [Monilinia vaccinii-corymbosi]|uniref:Uncharacterized protein n=1 Tax=Monilinia vaccinii-corymbosi TaxID=61207 RepID=A0A8A3PGK1_9HELO|nr:hypothetical protein DSL72_005729 [Monilinia vaccinii-corymbosi]
MVPRVLPNDRLTDLTLQPIEIQRSQRPSGTPSNQRALPFWFTIPEMMGVGTAEPPSQGDYSS